MNALRIDIFHDTVCPWCRIGKRNLAVALEQLTAENNPVEADIHYRSFYLQPNLPEEGKEFRSVMMAKGDGQIPLEMFFDGPRKAGEAVGLRFNFEAITRAPNTTRSHQLIFLVDETHRAELVEALYVAYFENGEDISDLNVLSRIAGEHGLDPEQTRRDIENGLMRDEVMADIAFAQQVGISGVPLFIFNNKYAVSGAQPVAVMKKVIQQITEGTVQSA